MTETSNCSSSMNLALHLKSESPEVYDFNVTIYGYILPSIAFIVITVNILMIAVFARGNFRSATHVVLIGLAAANILQVISIIIPSIYFYDLGFAEEYVPYDWCALRNLLLTSIPKICTIWARLLTTILSIQRYIIVSFPIMARSILKVKRTVVIIAVLLCISVLFNLKPLFGYKNIKKVYLNSTVTAGKEVSGCIWQRTTDFNDNGGLALHIVKVYIPAIVMLGCTLLINYSLIKNRISRQKTMDQRIRKMIVITNIIVLVVIVDSLLEALFKYSSFSTETPLCPFCDNRNNYFQGYMKCIRFLTFAANFIIYSLLSKQFREALKCLLCCQNNDQSKTQCSSQVKK